MSVGHRNAFDIWFRLRFTKLVQKPALGCVFAFFPLIFLSARSRGFFHAWLIKRGDVISTCEVPDDRCLFGEM